MALSTVYCVVKRYFVLFAYIMSGRNDKWQFSHQFALANERVGAAFWALHLFMIRFVSFQCSIDENEHLLFSVFFN